jgi:hypothetical protein
MPNESGQQQSVIFSYDASNMPSWMTPPWITPVFRTGPMALPVPGTGSAEEGPMFAGIPTQPLLPFDTVSPTDVAPIGSHFAAYPTAAIPTGRALSAGQYPPFAGNDEPPTPGSFLETWENWYDRWHAPFQGTPADATKVRQLAHEAAARAEATMRAHARANPHRRAPMGADRRRRFPTEH